MLDSGVLPGYFVLCLVLIKGVIDSQLVICTELGEHSSVFIRDFFFKALFHYVDDVVANSCVWVSKNKYRVTDVCAV